MDVVSGTDGIEPFGIRRGYGTQHTLANNTRVKSMIVKLQSNIARYLSQRLCRFPNKLGHKAATVHTLLHTWPQR
jgi:hypothetical protein